MNSYGDMLQAISEQNQNHKFQEWLSEKRNQLGLGLMSFLIMPVQR